jgi:hypothetical protein
MSFLSTRVTAIALTSLSVAAVSALPQQPPAPGRGQARQADAPDDVRTLVGRLDLERYKATIKGLTAFGDRREGTERNRKAVDWIETQLKSYGCETARLTYDPAPPREGRGGARGRGAGAGRGRGAGGRRPRATPDAGGDA